MVRAALALLFLLLSGASWAADNTPFYRMGAKFRFPVTTTPAQYMITQMDGASSYRLVNRCFVDVVITTVYPTEAVVTKPTTYNGSTIPNVLTVTSQTDTVVDDSTGTLFLARTSEVLSSSTQAASALMPVMPKGVRGRIISIKAVDDPSPKTCAVDFQYGSGL